MKHVLVIRLSALGDAAMAMPIVKSYALANTNLLFTVAGPPLLKPLFEGIENVDYIGIEKSQQSIRIFQSLKKVQADAVADLHRVNRVSRAIRLLQLDALMNCHPLKVRHIKKGRLSRWLFLHHFSHRPRQPQWLRYADVFERLGIHCDSPIKPIVSKPIHSNIQPTIGIAPFAQHQGKIWPWPNVEQLTAILASRGYRIILFGSKKEASQLESLAAKIPKAESIAGKLDFGKELEVITQLDLMVSMDSANMHFASVVGTRVISIWGATHPDFGFLGIGQSRTDALCASLPCQPCSAYGQRRCRFGDQRCFNPITPDAVIQHIEMALHPNISDTTQCNQ